MSTYVAIIGTEPATVYALDRLKLEILDRAPEKPEDYITLYEQRHGAVELRPLELRTAEVSRDDAFRYLRTMLIDLPAGRSALAKLRSDDVRGAIDWDVKL
jgi:hypothetical protein